MNCHGRPIATLLVFGTFFAVLIDTSTACAGGDEPTSPPPTDNSGDDEKPPLAITLPPPSPPGDQTPPPETRGSTEPVPPDTCGFNAYGDASTLESRIIGEKAKPNEFPWQVRLNIKTDAGVQYVCGGAIIAPKYVMTAAHCIVSGTETSVIAGGHSLARESFDAITQVAKIAYRHPEYNNITGEFDIAILELSNRLQFNNRIQPICVPRQCRDDCQRNDYATISGWGTTSESSSKPSDVLRKARVKIVSRSTCERALEPNSNGRVLSSSSVCAGNSGGSQGSCRGDDGGPLSCIVQSDGRFHLSGIRSFVDNCAKAGVYSIYTRPCSVINWIDQITRFELKTTTTLAPTTSTDDPWSASTSDPWPSTSDPWQTSSTPPTPPPTPPASSTSRPSSNKWVNHKDCGIRSIPAADRIVGGVEAAKHEFPWQVRVMTDVPGAGLFICGGSLINKEWVLSAAHCIASSDTKGGTSTIYVGGHRSDSMVTGELRMPASREIPHPKYNEFTNDYDFAMLKLERPVEFNDQIRPVCLLDSTCVGERPPGTNCSISGWGTLFDGGGAASPTLQKANVPLISRANCQKSFRDNNYGDIITNQMVCAGYPEGGTDTCQGDSGGPLACNEGGNTKYFLNGVTSFGYGCARAGHYGVYARPCSVMSWIKQMVRRDGRRLRRRPNANS